EVKHRDNRVAVAFGIGETMRRLGLVGLLGVLACFAASCSHDCRGSLKEVGAACPATFDGTEAQFPSCPAAIEISARQCGDLIELELFGGLGGTQCAYDARTHALVGAIIYTDVNEYCSGDSFTKMAGQVPDMSCTSMPFTLKKTCSPVSPSDGAVSN